MLLRLYPLPTILHSSEGSEADRGQRRSFACGRLDDSLSCRPNGPLD